MVATSGVLLDAEGAHTLEQAMRSWASDSASENEIVLWSEKTHGRDFEDAEWTHPEMVEPTLDLIRTKMRPPSEYGLKCDRAYRRSRG